MPTQTGVLQPPHGKNSRPTLLVATNSTEPRCSLGVPRDAGQKVFTVAQVKKICYGDRSLGFTHPDRQPLLEWEQIYNWADVIVSGWSETDIIERGHRRSNLQANATRVLRKTDQVSDVLWNTNPLSGWVIDRVTQEKFHLGTRIYFNSAQ